MHHSNILRKYDTVCNLFQGTHRIRMFHRQERSGSGLAFRSQCRLRCIFFFAYYHLFVNPSVYLDGFRYFFLAYSLNCYYNQCRTFVLMRYLERGKELMTKNERVLIELIRNSDSPQQAFITALEIICQYVAQHESLPERPAVDLQEST